MHQIKPLYEMTQELSLVAMGLKKADLVIKGGKLINVNTHEIIPDMDVAIVGGRIALVGDATPTIGEDTEVIDASGYYLSPGFMDGHIHVESSMLTVSQYSKTVVPRGTTAIFMDPHEIANVLGLEGVQLMIDEGKKVPLRVYVAMPSCVPAAPGFEDAGAKITPLDIKEAMTWEEVAGLGEMMNFPGVVYGDKEVHDEIKYTLQAKKCVTGHFSLPETGKMLNAYIASGCRSCHESVRKEDALAKMRLGMYAKLREGSAWHDLKEVVKAITENQVSARFAILISDDTHPDTLINKGHLDYIVKRAIQEGVNPITAIEMVTINVAECFYMGADFGSISPGKIADILLISDLTKVRVEQVFIGGKLVAKGGQMKVDTPQITYPNWSKNTVKVGKTLSTDDFSIKSTGEKRQIRVIEIAEAKVGTKHLIKEVPVTNGFIEACPKKDLAKVAIFERHNKTLTKGLGLVSGFGIKKGAVGSTVAHDSHNLLLVGVNDQDLALAGNELINAGGGMIVVAEGKILALLSLPIAGLLTNSPVEEVEAKVLALDKAWKEIGCKLISPFMTMALLGLPVLPELRITNRGLVDTVNFKFVDLFAD